MKKRNLFITIALVIVISFTALACANLGEVPVKGKQDYSYIVLSNGGSAVQYGNYVYFINGYKGYEDEDAKQNVFNKVEKGGIYRAELVGGNNSIVNKTYNFSFGQTTQKTFEPTRDSKTMLSIKTTTSTPITGYEVDENGKYLVDDDGEYIAIKDELEYANVELIAPKVIGTSGYSEGGIFIFDEYVFYASPHNEKDKTGTVQVTKTDFYRTKLDGSETKKIYTTENDTTSSPYMFYKYDGAYYLVVLDGTDAVSVKIDKKIRDPKVFAEDVTNLYLPNKGVYYKGMPENTVEDFVYVLRAPISTDPYRIGNVLEMRRPDGEDGEIISANGRTTSIIGSNGGTFFYMVDDVVKYSNYSTITGNKGSRIVGEFDFNMSSRYTSYVPVHPNSLNNGDVYLIASDDNALYRVDKLGNQTVIYDNGATVVTIDGGYVYFTSSVRDKAGNVVNMLLRADMFVGNIEVLLNNDKISDVSTYKYDILADFVVYFADIDSQAPTYAFFKELSRGVALSDLNSILAKDVDGGAFIGYRISDETTDEDDLYPDED